MKQYLVIKLTHDTVREDSEINETVESKLTRLLVIDSSFDEVENLDFGFWDSFAEKAHETLGYIPNFENNLDRNNQQRTTAIAFGLEAWIVTVDDVGQVKDVEEPSYSRLYQIVATIGKLTLE